MLGAAGGRQGPSGQPAVAVEHQLVDLELVEVLGRRRRRDTPSTSATSSAPANPFSRKPWSTSNRVSEGRVTAQTLTEAALE